MEIQQIESFVEVTKLLSFSKAAENLHVTQSTISARIQKLEMELGATLFLRSGSKGIRLSPQGEIFLPYAQKCLETLNIGVKKLRENPFAKLTLSSANPFGTFLLPELLSFFYETYPEMEVQVLKQTGFSEDILNMVLESQVDFGFLNDDFSLSETVIHPEVVVMPLYCDDLLLVAKPTHSFTNLEEISANQLAEQKMVHLGRKTSVTKHTKRYLDLHQIKPVGSFEINNMNGIKEMVKKTDMLTFLPRLSVMEDLQSGELVELPLVPSPPPLVTFLVCSSACHATGLAKEVKRKIEMTVTDIHLPCRLYN